MLLRLLVVFALTLFEAHAETQGLFSDDVEEFERSTNQSLLWAPYRSNCYFGVRPRFVNENPLMMGLMWFDASHAQGISSLRHFVEQNDRLEKYGYELYDPRIGGKETIIDRENNLNLTIHFVKSKDGENWAVRVSGSPLDSSKLSASSLVVYLSQNGPGGRLESEHGKTSTEKRIELKGSAPELGDYEITIEDISGQHYKRGPALGPDIDGSKTSHMSLTVPDDQVWKARDIFQSLLTDSIQNIITSEIPMDALSIPSALMIRNIHNFPPGNFHFVQKTFDLAEPFEFDIIFNNKASRQPIGSSAEVSNLISWSTNELKARFDSKFDIKDSSLKQFAQETLANLLGGIGYFHGTQLVDRSTEFDEEQFNKIELRAPREEGPIQLFSSVPSRAFFPRGFYWDEGFHMLQVMEYDFDLVLEILQSWFLLIEDDSGWVGRELILGSEARSKVPEEFQVQNPNIANPPTLLLCFSEMLTRAQEFQDSIAGGAEESSITPSSTEELLKRPELLMSFAEKVYPKLLKHYEWWTGSQRGFTEEYSEVLQDGFHPNEAFRWVGRTFTHCLPSGLDDYPRAQPPDVAELHLDALSWAGIMSRSMKQIADVLNMADEVDKFSKIEQNIIENLDTIHWNADQKCYCDVTIDDDFDELRRFVCHEGYVTLLPFALKLVPRDSDKLQHYVELMGDTDKLFSDFGVLSLSKQDEYFETGEAYWRGPVWINMNYLLLDSLLYYFQGGGENQDTATAERARAVYSDLRKNLISNMHRVWSEKGYVYENYNQRTGNGSGVQHFTGWSALIVNIMGRLPVTL
ncbi:Cwh41p [Lachancea thermotolerans]